MKRFPQVALILSAALLLGADEPKKPPPKAHDQKAARASEESGPRIRFNDQHGPSSRGRVARLPGVRIGPGFWGFSPDEKLITAAGKLWELPTGRLLAEIDPAGAILFSRSGSPLEVRWEADVVHVKDLLSGVTVLQIPGREPLLASLSPPWSASSPLMLVPRGDDAAVELWNLEGKRLTVFENTELHEDLVARGSRARFVHDWLTVSQNGSRLAWLSPRREIYTWDLDTLRNKPRVMLCGADDGGRKRRTNGDVLIPSLNGDLAALLEYVTSGGKMTAVIRIWDLRTGKQRCAVRQQVSGVGVRWPFLLYVSFSLSGDELLTMAFREPFAQPPDTPEVFVWDTRTGRQLRRWALKTLDQFHAFLASADAYCLAYTSHQQFWRLREKEKMSRGLNLCPRFAGHFVMSGDGFLLIKPPGPAVRETASQLPIPHMLANGCRRPIAFSQAARYLVGTSGGRRDRIETLVWDLRPELSCRREPSEDVAALLAQLRSPDVDRAQRAVARLIALGDSVLAHLHVHARRIARAERIRKLISQLDHDEFAVREAASRGLSEIGAATKEALERALRESPSAEVRGRAKSLLLRIATAPQPGDVLFELRVVQVLAGIASTAARDALRQLAQSPPNDRVATLAALSLRRLEANSK